MHDIKVSLTPKKNDFEISSIGSRLSSQEEKATAEPSDKIKVKFEKFVNLVATHDFEDVMKRYKDEDIILSSNLLSDLASAHDEIEEKTNKTPLFLIIGIVIGVAVTFLLTRL